MSKAAASLPEEALEKVIAYVDGPLNRRAERLLKSRLLLAPAGLLLTLGFRSFVAVRDGDLGALLGRRHDRASSRDLATGGSKDGRGPASGSARAGEGRSPSEIGGAR